MSFQFLKDPNLFNWIILILYIVNSVRQLFDNNLAQFCYWLLAAGGMIVVMFMFK